MGKHVPTESLYFAKLDAGEYEVTSMGSIGPGPGLLLALLASDHAATDRQLPKFNIEAGRLANLGTIVYAPEIEKEQPARMFLLNGLAGKQSAKSTLLNEAKRADISLVEGGGWTSSATAEAEAAALAQARPFVSMLSFQKPNRGLLAGSHLGQILRRTGPQAWNRETIDTLNRVSSVTETADGRTVAGSEYGEYFVKVGNAAWRSYRLPNQTGRITHIEPRGDGGAIFVVGDLLQTRLLLKKSIEDSAEAPIEIAKIEAPPDSLLLTGKEIVLAWNIPGITRETVITRIDKQTLKVVTQREKFWVMDWQSMPDGEVKLTRQNGMSAYLSASADNMQTWGHNSESGSISNYWRDTKRAVSLEFAPGFVMVSNKLCRTEDGGKTWVNFGTSLDTRHFAGRIVFADANEILIQGSHMLYSTIDNGQTWKRIFPLNPP